MELWLEAHGLLGIAIGLCAFLTIGVFHPIVIKTEYYLGTKCWAGYLIVGLGLLAATTVCKGVLLQAIMGVAGFSCLWGILELFQQQERVRKGWFPRNPRRRYPWDDATKHGKA